MVKTNYPEPKTIKDALQDPGWTNAMREEMGTLHVTYTFELVPPDPNIQPLGCKWVFKTKLNADGPLDNFKVRLVAKGYEQEKGIDYIETYIHVVRTTTIRAILHIDVINKWDIKQLRLQT